MDIFLVSMATEDKLQLGCGDDFTDDVEHIVADDAFCRREIADTHLDDPALDVGDFIRAPLLHVFLHTDVFWLPVVVLHRLVEVIRPLIFQREDVKEHRLLAIDDALAGVGLLGFFAVEREGAISEGYRGSFSWGCDGGGHDLKR